MDSPLTVAAYRQLLTSDRDERDDAQQLIYPETLGLCELPDNRFDALKAAVRRKRKRPVALTPIDSPQQQQQQQHQHQQDQHDDDDDTVPDQVTTSLSTMTTLPPLTVNILQRKKLFLSPTGEPVVGIEEILQLQELNLSPPKRSSPFQLIAVPRKVFEEDEVALMPCHTLHYRMIPSLQVERWKEPIRDRDKNWRDDELNMILATQGSMHESHKLNKMTRTAPGNVRKGTWRRLDSQRLQVKTSGSNRTPTSPINISGITSISETVAVTATETTTTITTPAVTATTPRDPTTHSEVLLRSQGAMISRTYCIVTIYGIGIYGRLYAEGLDDRRGRDRYLKVDTYDPLTSRINSLRVSMADLEWVFESQPELLAAGKKQTVLKKVIGLLFFQYPDDDKTENENENENGDFGGVSDSGDANRVAVGNQARLSITLRPPPAPGSPATEHGSGSGSDSQPRLHPPSQPQSPLQAIPESHSKTPQRLVAAAPTPQLCISPDEKLNQAAKRRLERQERLKREERERLRLLALLMKMPKRARHRVLFQLVHINGHAFLVSIYHFPTQVRNFLIVAYNPRTSRTLSIAVGVMEAAALSRTSALPHKWSQEQKKHVAQVLVSKLHLRASKSKMVGHQHTTDGDSVYRISLAIREDRMGPQASWLALPVPRQSDSKKQDAVAKYKKDGHQELTLTLETQLQTIHETTRLKTEQLLKDIAHAEATIVALRARDAELQEQIEDINSGKGVPVAVLAEESHSQTREKPQHQQLHHEARRGFKAARKTIKDESKALQARVVACKKELAITKEHDLVEKEKIQARYNRAMEMLTQRAVTATLPLWFDARDRVQPRRQSHVLGNRQRTTLHRSEIRDGCVSLASGACRVGGRAYRFSVFAELSTPPPQQSGNRKRRPAVVEVKEEIEDVVVEETEDVEVKERTAADTETVEAKEDLVEVQVSDDEPDEDQETKVVEDDEKENQDEMIVEDTEDTAVGKQTEETEAGEDDAEESSEDEMPQEEEEEEETIDRVRWFQLDLYDALTSERHTLRLTRLEWIAFAKQKHDALLRIAPLGIATSPVVQQIHELDTSYETTRSALVALKKLKKNDKKRKQMTAELTSNRQQRRVLWKDGAPWHVAVNELCKRLQLLSPSETVAFEMDRCLYRATLSVVSLAVVSDSTQKAGGGGDDDDAVVDCEVWVTQVVDSVRFHARDLATNEVWTLAYPDSAELVKEFAVETPVELQLHLEAIAMTLLLYTDHDVDDNDDDGDDREKGGMAITKRKMRFEE